MNKRLLSVLVFLCVYQTVFGVTKTALTGILSWNTAVNWLPIGVPGAGDDVVIPALCTMTMNTSPTVKSITINGSFSLGGNTLTLTGDFTNNGTFTHANGTLSTAATGVTNILGSNASTFYNILVAASSTFRASTTTNMVVVGNLTNNGTFATNAHTIVFNGTTVLSGTQITVFNNIIINSGKTLTAHATLQTQFKGNITNNGTYNANSSLTVFALTTTLSGSSTTSFNNVTIVSGGTLTAPSGNMNITGNFANSGTFNHNNGTINFNGGAAQTISGTASSTFYNLTVNNSSTGVTLSQSATVSNQLTLSSGALKLNQNTLIVDNTSNTAIARTTGYIVSEDASLNGSGKANDLSVLQWNTSGHHAYVFPFGTTTGNYIPVTIDVTGGNAKNISVATYSTAANNLPLPVPVNNVDDYTYHGVNNSVNTADRFWEISSTGASSTANLTFTYASAETPANGEVGTDGLGLVAQGWGTNKWNAPSASQTNNAVSNTVTVSGVSNMNTAWALALHSSPLPITLVYFKALNMKNYIELEWLTSSESNNDFFTVERSSDGINFMPIGKSKGAGNSNWDIRYSLTDQQPFEEKSYYRLKQTDFNGDFEYSSVIAIERPNGVASTVKVYPNPSNGMLLTVDLSTMGKDFVELSVHNAAGSLEFFKTINIKEEGTLFNVGDVMRLKHGVHIIQLKSSINSVSQKVVIE